MGDTEKCPFCKEDGFDLVGLKYHYKCWIERYCQKYRDTLTVEEESNLSKIKRNIKE